MRIDLNFGCSNGCYKIAAHLWGIVYNDQIDYYSFYKVINKIQQRLNHCGCNKLLQDEINMPFTILATSWMTNGLESEWYFWKKQMCQNFTYNRAWVGWRKTNGRVWIFNQPIDWMHQLNASWLIIMNW